MAVEFWLNVARQPQVVERKVGSSELYGKLFTVSKSCYLHRLGYARYACCQVTEPYIGTLQY